MGSLFDSAIEGWYIEKLYSPSTLPKDDDQTRRGRKGRPCQRLLFAEELSGSDKSDFCRLGSITLVKLQDHT